MKRLADDKLEYLDSMSIITPKLREQLILDLERVNNSWNVYKRHTKILKPFIEKAISCSGGRPVRIVDVGAGSGGLLIEISRTYEYLNDNIQFTGIDTDPTFIKLAKRLAAENHIENVKFIQADGTQLLDICDNYFDITICNWVFHHLAPEKVAAIINELYRITGSTLYIFDFNRCLWGTVFVSILSKFVYKNKELMHDAVTSSKKAYKIKEIKMISSSTRAAGRLKFKRIAPYCFFLAIASKS